MVATIVAGTGVRNRYAKSTRSYRALQAEWCPVPMFKGFTAGLDKGKTFRPRRHHKAGTKRYELHKYAQATLGAGNLHDAVTLPEGEDLNEWLAVNVVDFFNEM